MHKEYPAIYMPRRLRRGRVTGHDFDAIAPGEHKGVRLKSARSTFLFGRSQRGHSDLFSGTTVVRFRMQGRRAFASVGSCYWLRLTAATLFTLPSEH